jgi:hypothetical protein
MDDDVLIEMLKALDGPQHQLSRLRQYYEGNPPLSFLSADSKKALQGFDKVSANVCRTVVISLAERLRVASFEGDEGGWDLWLRNDLDELSDTAPARTRVRRSLRDGLA